MQIMSCNNESINFYFPALFENIDRLTCWVNRTNMHFEMHFYFKRKVDFIPGQCPVDIIFKIHKQ